MKSILAAAAAMIAITGAAFLPTSASAQVSVNVIIGEAPPPPRYEVAPPPRPGYIWAPGFWNWEGRSHVWVPGHWEPARAGEYYRRPEWVRSPEGWRLQRGGWHHDERRHESHEQHERERRHEEWREHEYRDFHCPPGQAKKGNC